jgi:hypothetical protein
MQDLKQLAKVGSYYFIIKSRTHLKAVEKKREKKIMGRQTKKLHQARFLVRSAELEL